MAVNFDTAQDSLVSKLASNDDQKAALTLAFYNTLLFTLLGISLACIFAVYQMLSMFLMPMLWASLVGTVLFPLKRMFSTTLKGWLDQLDELDRPLLVGVALLPIQTVLNASNFVYETTLSFAGICIGVAYLTLKFFCYYDAFTTLLNWISRLYASMDSMIGFFTLNWVFIVVLLYVLGLAGWIYLQELGQINKKLARLLSLPAWLFLLARLSDLFGPFRVLVFTSSCTLLALISAGLIDHQGRDDEDVQLEAPEEASEKSQKVKQPERPEHQQQLLDMSTRTAVPLDVESRLDQALSSDAHLRIICALCALLFVVNHDSLVVVLLFLFCMALCAKLGEQLGLNDIAWNLLVSFKQKVLDGSGKYIHVFVAGPLRKFVALLFTSDRMFITGLSARVDLISSICVMATLAIGSLFFLLFTAFQLHGETVHLVKLGGNVLSSNPEWLRYALNYTEGRLGEHDLDNYMEQAYQQSRTWVASNIRSLVDPRDQTRADKLEEQAKLLVDNLYRLWEERGGQHIFEDPLAMDSAIGKGMDREGTMERARNDGQWMTRLVRNANFGLWRSELTALVQENLEMVLAIAHSLWHVLLANLSLLTTVLLAALGLLLGFGFELLNFLIECLVFLTVVYYLLANSDEQWLPLHWVNDASASLQIQQLTNGGGGAGDVHGRRVDVAKALEGAISGVFVLSAKMSIFYGLYTHFVHSLFALNVVFLPALLASILAAIPIIPPYAVALLGFGELWLVRGEPVAAIVFACASVAPLFFADPAFYREVKGSHPYMTGLAVVGGIYWLGLQGAIIGPILLCLMIALLNVYAEFANHRPVNNRKSSKSNSSGLQEKQ